MFNFVLATLVCLAPMMSFAHEGHDKTPGLLPLDGFDQIQATDHLYLKLKVEADGVKVYPFTHENKAVPVTELKLDGAVTPAKKTKSEKISFTPGPDSFGAKIDAKGAHRYTLELAVSYQGKKEKVKFNVEPQ